MKTIVVSAGGGGLLAGIATAVKALKPDVRIIGVQAEQAAAYPLSWRPATGGVREHADHG